jgi:hypothetical protein
MARTSTDRRVPSFGAAARDRSVHICPATTMLSLETAIDDGRFTGVVEGLSVGHSGPDPIQDARRFARGAARLIREVSLDPRV